jgi:transcriptional regulator with XRE-family HTH domain
MVQMKTVGQSLRDTRESKGITIKQVSNSIKIRESLIEALETGEYYQFSSDMHLKSFLRSYANYLGLSEEMIMALYRRERRIDYPEDDKVTKGKMNNKGTFVFSKYLSPKLLISLVALFLTIGIVYFFFTQWKAFNTPPILDISFPKQNEVLTAETFTIEGFTGDPSVKVILDGNEANYVNSQGSWKINAHFTEPGIKRFQVIAENQFNKRTERTLDLVYKPEVKETKHKVRIKNISKSIYTVPVIKDSLTTSENIAIGAEATVEIQFDKSIKITNFDKNILQLFFDEDAESTNSIDSKDFIIFIENNRPIIKLLENEKPKTTQTPTVLKTATPTFRAQTPIPTISQNR